MSNDFPPPKQQLTVNDNRGYGGGAMGGGFDPQALQQMLAAALAQSGGNSPPMTGGQWQQAANAAPRQGGMGGTVPMDSMMMQRGGTPQQQAPGFPEERMPMGSTGSVYGGNSPPDAGVQGQTPRILDRLPDQPPMDRSGMPTPIPTDPAQWNMPPLPIDNQPFGFGMNGGMFGGGGY